MFSVNLKKDWKMQKSLIITFIFIALAALIVITGVYAVIKFVDLSGRTEIAVKSIWTIVSSLIMSLAGFVPLIFMFKLLKDDLGKKNIHYTLFTPQSIISWFLPKLLIIIAIQGIFTLINLGYAYLVLDISKDLNPNQPMDFDLKQYLVSFISGTFAIGIFGLMTLGMALYYSFRKKGLSWLFIILSVGFYGLFYIAFVIFIGIKQFNATQAGIEFDMLPYTIIQYLIDTILGFIFIGIGLFLYDKKVEY